MVRLSYMANAINTYLKLNGDKEVISFGTYNGSSDIDYEIKLADIYDGPIGTNPFTGKASIKLMKDGESLNVSGGEKQSGADPKAMKAYFELAETLQKQEDKPIYTRLSVLYGALSVMHRMGSIDSQMMNALWNDFALDVLGLQ